MRDCRTELVTALKVAIDAKTTGLTFYTKVPKDISYPFIYVTDISDIENGPKNAFYYEYDLSIEIVYKDLTDKAAMWATVNSIKEIFCNDAPFTLTGGFEIMQALLTDTTETEDLLNSQEVDTTTIRINFQIEDKN